MRPVESTLRGSAACLALLACYAVPGEADAAVFAVSSVLDQVDAAPGDGVCATAAATCTLRAAVQEANALAGADDIMLPPGNYALTISGSNENAAATGDLDITSTLRILGTNPATTTIDASGLAVRDRVFHVLGGTTRFRRVAIEGGRAQNGGGIAVRTADVFLREARVAENVALVDGGGIWNNDVGASVTIENSKITGNDAAEHGGGIANVDGAILTVNDSDVTFNQAGDEGGGIYNYLASNAFINGSTVANNAGLGVFSLGGGIANIDGSMSLEHTTISDNSAGTGGGIYHQEDTFFAVLETFFVTVSRNEATGATGGGGLFVQYGDVDLNLLTVDDNHATNGDGGGLYLDPDSNTTELRQSQVFGNSASVNGGGIAYFGAGNSFGAITRTAIHENTATNGGGIYVQHPANFQLTLLKNTVSGNEADVNGGGLYLFGLAGSTIDLAHVTVADNDAAHGGGIWAQNAGASYGAYHLLLAQNEATAGGSGDNCEGDGIDSSGFNLVEHDDGCTFSAIASDDVGTAAAPIDPLIGPLQDNGGASWTHAIAPNSPARDNGHGFMCTGGGASDQRGMTMPVSECDIGAYELQ